eukprot:Filipodium_phascolosomae@DN8497_c0_g1_i1.p1
MHFKQFLAALVCVAFQCYLPQLDQLLLEGLDIPPKSNETKLLLTLTQHLLDEKVLALLSKFHHRCKGSQVSRAALALLDESLTAYIGTQQPGLQAVFGAYSCSPGAEIKVTDTEDARQKCMTYKGFME